MTEHPGQSPAIIIRNVTGVNALEEGIRIRGVDVELTDVRIENSGGDGISLG